MHSGGLGSHSVERGWQVAKNPGVKKQIKDETERQAGRFRQGAAKKKKGSNKTNQLR